jgi:predicted TIM-barrel fold metal-dependent hydrolase
MRIDVHVHVCAMSAGHGAMSRHLYDSIPFRFMRWRLGVNGRDPHVDDTLARSLARQLDETPELDAAVVLAFDAVHRPDGTVDRERTHLYVKNDYVVELARQHPKVLFGASVHPYRKDAVAEIERCVGMGAKLMKWLPIVQDFNPSDPRCTPFYEALAHHKLPLLCHTGAENALPNLDQTTADPMLLRGALERGVTVIMAHCGSRLWPWEVDYVGNFIRLANEFEHCYGDTSALNVPGRWYALTRVLADAGARQKLVHGSDWPILPVPPPGAVGGWTAAKELMRERNWIRRDVLIKQRIAALDDAYWHRAARVLGMGESVSL